MPGGWPQKSRTIMIVIIFFSFFSLSLSLSPSPLSLLHTHSCTHNWFGDNCTQHICDKVIENGEAPLCENGGTCLVNPSNISNYLCSCPLGYTGRNCQYITHGGMCTCMHMYIHTCTNMCTYHPVFFLTMVVCYIMYLVYCMLYADDSWILNAEMGCGCVCVELQMGEGCIDLGSSLGSIAS